MILQVLRPLNSVEVYARARTDLPISKEKPSCQLTNQSFQMDAPSDSAIGAYIESVSCLTHLIGQSTKDSLSAGSAEIMNHIIQQTVLTAFRK
jgi:hypothetical protein